MPPTWDEYLIELSEYLAALRRAAQSGFACTPSPPERPQDPLPEDRRDAVVGLREECDRLTSEVKARMTTMADRAPLRASPHRARPATYLVADI